MRMRCPELKKYFQFFSSAICNMTVALFSGFTDTYLSTDVAGVSSRVDTGVVTKQPFVVKRLAALSAGKAEM